ncbi:unnamed protein product [Euphydryas editha]|uniref:Uncharacterized protein n=1 Tax=Euphydryas editha TaxID=104508 RepID=A0AAU9UYA9_EUPED|nr:unnamed protein product [Euphydryas editha]
MRLLFVVFLLYIVFVSSAPQSKLQFGNEDNNMKQVVEEVVVESVLHIKSQSGNRQARTEARTNLKDGARVAETRNY